MKRIIPIILLIGFVFTLFGGIPSAHAQSIFKGDEVPAGESVDQNVVLFGDKIVVDGTVEGDVLAIGKDVIVNGPIKGSLIVLALSAEVKNSIGGSLYAGLLRSLVLRSKASIANDVYMAGTEISTEPDASIGRDLMAITLGADLKGKVVRNTNGLFGVLPILDVVWKYLQDLNIPEMRLFGFSSQPPMSTVVLSGIAGSPMQGILASVAGLSKEGLSASQGIGQISAYLFNSPQVAPLQVGSIQWSVIGDWFLNRLRALVIYLVFSGLALLILPKIFVRSSEKIWEKPLQSTGWGVMVVVFTLAAILLLFIVLIPVMIFFSILTLETLAVYLGILGYTSLVILSCLFLALSLYVTKGLAGYLVGYKILRRFFPKATRFRFVSLLIGGILYVLVISIPYLGGVISLWLSFMGLGAIWLVLQERRKLPVIQEGQEVVPQLESDPADMSESAVDEEPAMVAEPSIVTESTAVGETAE